MKSYRVVWEIDAEAETPREAAEFAWRQMQREGSIANVFTVVDKENDEAVQIDLEEKEEAS